MRQSTTDRAIPRAHDSSTSTRTGKAEAKRFEVLVGELSAAMARVPADGVDAEVDAWLSKICYALDLDRSAIYERNATTQKVRTTHTWLRSNIPPFPEKYDPEKLLGKTTKWILAGNQLVFSHPSEIPAEFNDTRRFVERYGPVASAIIPIFGGDRVIGGASFGRFRASRRWHADLLNQLGLAARIFGGAIERKQAEEVVRAARIELALAQRRSMMGELVASIAHELNQPLSAILSNLGGLERLLSSGHPELATAAKVVG
ncbi:MAG: GAF domain-containing protein, partial [Terriglobia bacterium]